MISTPDHPGYGRALGQPGTGAEQSEAAPRRVGRPVPAGRLDHITYRAVLDIHSGGSLVSLRCSHIDYAHPVVSHHRGPIGYLSRPTAMRLMRKVATVDRSALGLWVGLTYSDDVIPADCRRAKSDFRAFLKRLSRRVGRPLGAIWVIQLEPRKSGRFVGAFVPHFHMLLYGCDYIPWRVVAGAWCDGFRYPSVEAREAHFQSCSTVRRIWHAGGAGSYMGKLARYIASSGEDGPEHIGRRWGVAGEDVIPWAQLMTYTVPWEEFHTVRRLLLRAAKLSGRVVRARHSGIGIFCRNPESFARLGRSP